MLEASRWPTMFNRIVKNNHFLHPEHVSLKVPNIEFDFHESVDCVQWQTVTSNLNNSFARYNKDSSMYVLGAPCCQQIQIHPKLNIKLNSTFGTFSGICPWPFSWLGFFAPILAQNNNCSFFLCPLVLHCPFGCFMVDWNPEQVRTGSVLPRETPLPYTEDIFLS